MDGGVGPKTIDVCADAGTHPLTQPPVLRDLSDSETSTVGSNVIVAGTAIFGASEPENVIALLKAKVEIAQAKIAAQRS